MNLRLSLLTLNGPQKGQRIPLFQGQVFHGSAFSDSEMLENHALVSIDSGQMWSVRTDGLSGQKPNRSANIRIGAAETEKISLIPGVIFHLGQTGFKVVEIPIDKDFNAPAETVLWLEKQNWQRKKPSVFFFLLPLRLSFIRGPQAGEHYTLSYGPRVLGFNQTDLNLLEPGLPKEAIHFTIDNLRPKIKKGSDFKVLVNDEDLSEHYLNDGDIIKIGINEIEISIFEMTKQMKDIQKNMLDELIKKETGYYKSFDGTNIYYEVRGQGEPIVFVYGIGCLMNHWHLQAEHFCKTHKVILFDIRGHHKSTPVANPANMSYEHLAFDLQGLIKHLGHTSAHIVGHSFGAPYLIKSYEQFPEIFKSLVFINGFARNPLKKVFGFEFVEPLFQFIRAGYAASPDLWTTLWRSMIDNPLAFQLAALSGGFNIKLTQFKDIEMYGRGISRIELPLFFELFDQMLKFDGTGILPQIDKPTLIIAGERDFLTPPEFQRELARAIYHAEFLLVPYGSHCSQLDFPDYINLKLAEFWKKVK